MILAGSAHIYVLPWGAAEPVLLGMYVNIRMLPDRSWRLSAITVATIYYSISAVQLQGHPRFTLESFSYMRRGHAYERRILPGAVGLLGSMYP